MRLPGSTPASPSPAMRCLALLPVPAALLVLAVLRPDLLSGLIASPRAWLVSAGVVLASVATRRLMRRWSPLGALVEAFPPVLASPVADATPVPTTTPSVTPSPLGSSVTQPPGLTARLLASGVLRGIGHRASGRAEAYALSGRIVIGFASVSFPGAQGRARKLQLHRAGRLRRDQGLDGLGVVRRLRRTDRRC